MRAPPGQSAAVHRVPSGSPPSVQTRSYCGYLWYRARHKGYCGDLWYRAQHKDYCGYLRHRARHKLLWHRAQHKGYCGYLWLGHGIRVTVAPGSIGHGIRATCGIGNGIRVKLLLPVA